MLGPCHNLHSLSSQLANFLDHGRICLLKSWVPFRIFFWFLVSCVVVLASLRMYVLDDEAMIAMVEVLTFPGTNSSRLKMDGWNSEYDPFLLGFGLFSGAKWLLVSGRVAGIEISDAGISGGRSSSFQHAVGSVLSSAGRCEEWKSVHSGNKNLSGFAF